MFGRHGPQFFQFTQASIHLWADLGEGLEAHPVIGGKHRSKKNTMNMTGHVERRTHKNQKELWIHIQVKLLNFVGLRFKRPCRIPPCQP